jgi:hypothetical protein
LNSSTGLLLVPFGSSARLVLDLFPPVHFCRLVYVLVDCLLLNILLLVRRWIGGVSFLVLPLGLSAEHD